MQEPLTGSTGTVVAIKHRQKREIYATIRRWIMYKNYALLSIGAALLCSLFFVDVGHAFQIDRSQDAHIQMATDMKGTANLPTRQVSIAPNPCTAGGTGRTGAPGTKRCPSGSADHATAGSLYSRQVSTTSSPCTEGGTGRTGAPGTKRCPSGSADHVTAARIVMAADMNSWTGVPLQVVGILFVAGLIALVGLGLRGLRHHHRHHA